MMTVYRLVKTQHARNAFSGEGARVYGGRWNPPDFPVIYASQSRALAALETFVHLVLEAPDLRFLLYEIVLPQDARLRHYEGPERAWRRRSLQATQEIGRAWLTEAESLALVVPSVIVPREKNFVLSPRHAQFADLRISKPEPFSFDGRMWKS